MSLGRTALVAAVALGASGCRPSEERQRVVLKDKGQLCLGTPATDGGVAGSVEVPQGLPLAISVRTHDCLSSCVTERKAHCVAKREGDRLVVSSELSWSAPEAIGRPCGGPCAVLTAQCSADAMQAGKVTVAHGASSVTLDVPSRLASGCVAANKVELASDAGAPPALGSAALAASAAASSAGAAPAPPATGAPPAPKRGDALCAVPYPAPKGAKGAPMGILVTRPNPCEGASCSAARPKCSFKRKGHHIVVKADFPQKGAKPKQPCSEDCAALLASCRTEPLPPGAYTIALGAQKLDVQVPLAKETCAD